MYSLIPLFLIHVLSLVSPGPDLFFVLNASSKSVRNGIFAGIGIFFGNAALVLSVVTLGSQILITYPRFFSLLKFAGAFYLLWIGLNIILSTFRNWSSIHSVTKAESVPSNSLYIIIKGCGMCVTNPKAVFYFTSFLPQYLFIDGQIFRAGVFLVLSLSLGWFLLVALIGSKIFSQMTNRTKDLVNLTFGCILILFSGIVILTGVIN